jgi:integral membrane protein
VLTNLRRISVIEAISYLALLIATILKQTRDAEIGVTILGPIHGVLYLIFAAMILRDRTRLGWPWIKALAAIVIGSLPFGGFWLDQKWLAPLQSAPAGR